MNADRILNTLGAPSNNSSRVRPTRSPKHRRAFSTSAPITGSRRRLPPKHWHSDASSTTALTPVVATGAMSGDRELRNATRTTWSPSWRPRIVRCLRGRCLDAVAMAKPDSGRTGEQSMRVADQALSPATRLHWVTFKGHARIALSDLLLSAARFRGTIPRSLRPDHHRRP